MRSRSERQRGSAPGGVYLRDLPNADLPGTLPAPESRTRPSSLTPFPRSLSLSLSLSPQLGTLLRSVYSMAERARERERERDAASDRVTKKKLSRRFTVVGEATCL